MNRLVMLVATVGGAFVLSACGGSEVVVQAQIQDSEGEVVALGDLPVRLLPYDRDVIFDSLEAAAARPQPPIPDSLLALQNAIATAQDDWQAAEARWGVVRDSLRGLSTQLQGMSRADPRYRVLYLEFEDLAQQERQYQQRMDQAFGRFKSLQSRFSAASEEIRMVRAQWADEAFSQVDVVIANRLKQIGRDVVEDTTNAAGVVRLRPRSGNWWLYARFELPYQELYWNIPVEVTRGDPVEIRLTRENAEVRPKL
jgi:hypothetical protein